jgi:hypothetical protein
MHAPFVLIAYSRCNAVALLVLQSAKLEEVATMEALAPYLAAAVVARHGIAVRPVRQRLQLVGTTIYCAVH